MSDAGVFNRRGSRSLLIAVALTLSAGFSSLTSCRSLRAIEGSAPAFTLADRELVPEGLAFDPEKGRFFISSVYRHKVVQRSSDGIVRDFTGTLPELGSILGLEVDRRRGLLWACSYAGPGGGTNALYAFDLQTGSLSRRVFPPDPAARHLLNDLELAPDGTLYVTDTDAGQLYQLRPGAEGLSTFLSASDFRSPNGVALAADRGVLFVADDIGLSAVDLRGRRSIRLEAAAGIDVAGIDGLYYRRGGLVAVQNSSPVLKPRVLSIDIAEDPWRVVRVMVLEDRPAVLDVPTTGALAGDVFYFIARSGLQMLGRNGGIRDLSVLREAAIRRVALPAGGGSGR